MTTYETLKPPGERYPMGRSHSMSKVKEEHKENNLLCKYNVGVVCQIPLKDRPCGKCGWRPSVEQKRKKQIEKDIPDGTTRQGGHVSEKH